MGDYRDEREAALQRAEALSQQNAQLQTELDAVRQGRASPATGMVPRVAALAVTFLVMMGAGIGFFTASRPAPMGTAAASLELRGRWSPPSPVAPVALRAAVRAGGGTWAVGDRGSIFFRAESATSWAPVPSGTEADLYAITSGDPLVAVGARGTALRFDPAQRRWVPESTGSTADLHAVASRQSTLIAVGSGGAVLRRSSEGAWTTVASNTAADLYGVTVSTPDGAVVAVGAGGTIVGGAFESAELTRQASPISSTLRAIAAWNNTLLAVGDGGAMVSTSAMSPWTVVPSASTTDLNVVASTEIPYEERRPGVMSSGSTFGFLAAGAGGTVLVDRLGSVEGWRSVRGGGGAIRAMISEPWSLFTDEGNVIAFTPR
jgi:hypothetical protein